MMSRRGVAWIRLTMIGSGDAYNASVGVYDNCCPQNLNTQPMQNALFS
jgi:hypothetical protein